ncbi:MAG: hypothetical protein VX777_07680, partial [Chlamydiota bacterium]|nr:hypothetical protein [Chlamydiota bacterium]
MNPILSAQETTNIIPSIDTSITSSQSNKVLTNLPPEILDIIFEKLAETGSLLDIFNLARSSKL